MPKDVERGVRAGFKQYLTKPIRVEEVMGTIKDILNT
jgi:DNA-binding response OmpR family regulator